MCHLSAMSCTVSNPVLYGWLNTNLRKEFIKVSPVQGKFFKSGEFCSKTLKWLRGEIWLPAVDKCKFEHLYCFLLGNYVWVFHFFNKTLSFFGRKSSKFLIKLSFHPFEGFSDLLNYSSKETRSFTFHFILKFATYLLNDCWSLKI